MPKQPVSKTTPPISDEQLEAFKTLIPQAFTEGKVDFEKLQAALGDLADARQPAVLDALVGRVRCHISGARPAPGGTD